MFDASLNIDIPPGGEEGAFEGRLNKIFASQTLWNKKKILLAEKRHYLNQGYEI